jgi:hypothetical protein
MQINDKDFGAYPSVVSGGGARGVAAGTGDNTEAYGEIVDQLAQPNLRSGLIVVAGSAILTDTKGISLVDVHVEHGDETDLSDKADFHTAAVFTDLKVSTGGTTEVFMIKVPVDLWGVKRYWRVAVTPDLDAANTDTFEIGFGFVAIGDTAPIANGAD